MNTIFMLDSLYERSSEALERKQGFILTYTYVRERKKHERLQS